MNTIFKVIWNKSLGSAIVVAENTKSIGRTTTKTVKNKSIEKQSKETIRNSCHFMLRASILTVLTTLITNTAIAAYATGDASIAYGGSLKPVSGTADSAFQKSGNIAFGTNSSAVGIGNHIVVDYASAFGLSNYIGAERGVAVGSSNHLLSGATNSSVFGIKSAVTAKNSTAIGYSSLADEENTISVGMSGLEKRITNVANGIKNTDAVNYGQMISTSNQIIAMLGGGASFANGIFTAPTFSIQGGNYSNIGLTFNAVNNELTALKSSVNDLQTYIDVQDPQISNNGQYISISGTGDGSTGTNATGQNSIAIGVNTVVTGHNSTAIGLGHQVSGNASGTFGDPNIVTGNGSYVIGNDNTVGGDNTFVLGNNVSTTAQNAVVLGNDSSSDRDNTVSVGSDNNQRQIVHVAAGTADTDAVNVAQMKQSSSDTVTSANNYTDTKFSYLESSLKDYSLQTERRFQEVDKRFDRQGAMSAAMMNMALSTNGLRGQNRVGVGAGLQGQESAIAVGYQKVVNENTSFSISGAATKNESSGGVGVGLSW